MFLPGNLLGDAGDEDPRAGPGYGGQSVPRSPAAVSHLKYYKAGPLVINY